MSLDDSDKKTIPPSLIAEVTSPAFPPSRVGKYTLRRPIATGGMGTVWEAEQDEPRRIVALKLMRATDDSVEWKRRFQAEAQAMARLRHANIAQVYEAGTHVAGHADFPFFAMEYIPAARPITRHADANGLDLRARIELAVKVCEAIHHAHQQGIIHRDIKPANILIGTDGVVKVIDFGVSRLLHGDDLDFMNTTQPGALLGTLAYMSPEQADGRHEAVDARSDVYSLGVVIYELLCGQLPYRLPPGYRDAVRVIAEEPAARPSSFTKRLKGDPNTVLLTAISKSPDDRYESAAALAADLRALLDGNAPQAAPRSAPSPALERVRRFVRRHPLAVHLIVFIVGIALAWAIVAPFLNNLPARFSPEAPTMEARFKRAMLSINPISVPRTRLNYVTIVRMPATRVGSNEPMDYRAFAESVGVEGMNEDFRSIRRLHGELARRLARSHASAVVFDLTFIGATPHDAALVDGLRSLNDAGIPVVIGENTKESGDVENVITSPAIAGVVRRGWVAAFVDPGRHWSMPIVIRRAGRTVGSSLALAGFGAARFSSQSPVLLFDPLFGFLFVRSAGGTTTQPAATPSEKRVEVESGDAISEPLPDAGFQKGDEIGELMYCMPSRSAMDASTVNYVDVFTMDDATLRETFEGKVLLVGDGRTPGDIELTYDDGTKYRGFEGQATALDALLSGIGVLTFPRGAQLLIAIAAGACAVAFTRRSRRVRLMAKLALTVIFVALGCILAYYISSVLNDPLPGITSVVVVGVGGVLVERARQRALS